MATSLTAVLQQWQCCWRLSRAEIVDLGESSSTSTVMLRFPTQRVWLLNSPPASPRLASPHLTDAIRLFPASWLQRLRIGKAMAAIPGFAAESGRGRGVAWRSVAWRAGRPQLGINM